MSITDIDMVHYLGQRNCTRYTYAMALDMNDVKMIAGAIGLHVVILGLSGCSLIGLGVGAIADAKSDGFEKKQPAEMRNEEPGQRVIAVRTRGDSTAGTFREMAPRFPQEYAQAFAPFEHTLCDGRFPPALGDTIKIVTKEGEITSVRRGAFCGFDPDYLYAGSIDNAGIIRIPLTDIETIIDTGRHVVRGDTVYTLLKQHRIPSVSAISIVAGTDIVRIPLDSITVVLVPRGMNGAVEGLLIGAALDVFAVAAVAAALPTHGVW